MDETTLDHIAEERAYRRYLSLRCSECGYSNANHAAGCPADDEDETEGEDQ